MTTVSRGGGEGIVEGFREAMHVWSLSSAAAVYLSAHLPRLEGDIKENVPIRELEFLNVCIRKLLRLILRVCAALIFETEV